MNAERALRGCVGKKRYTSEAFAHEVRRNCERKRGTKLRVYRCEVCAAWHLTSNTMPPAARCGLCLEAYQPTSRTDWACPTCNEKGATRP